MIFSFFNLRERRGKPDQALPRDRSKALRLVPYQLADVGQVSEPLGELARLPNSVTQDAIEYF
jgi:hypothetical protein